MRAAPSRPRCRLALGLPVLLAALAAAALPASAQVPEEPALAPGQWRAHPALRRVQALAVTPEAVWAGTDGGVFRYDPATGELTRFTRVEGLQRADVRALAHDPARDALWIGYDDGGLDRLDVATGRVTSYFDIVRATRFPRRDVRRLRLRGDSLLVATGFGVVVFDAARGVVRDTYEQFGPFPAGEPVADVLVHPLPDGRPGLWVATDEGVAVAPLAAPNLRAPGAWTALAGAPRPARSLGAVGGRIVVGRAERPASGTQPAVPGDLFRLEPDGTWQRLGATEQTVLELVPAGERLLFAAPFTVGSVSAEGGVALLGLGAVHLAVAAGPGGRVWSGTEDGLVLTPPLPTQGFRAASPERIVLPEGPLTNRLTAVGVGPDGTVWTAHAPEGVYDGLSRGRGGRWTHFTTRDGADVARAPFRVLVADRRGFLWAGSEGGGVTRIGPGDEAVTFRETNSTLRGDSGFEQFVVALGVAEDRDGRIWVTNRGAPMPLHVWDPERGWTALPRPADLPAAAGRFRGLTLDRFGRKWVRLANVTIGRGDGFAVIDTGADPFSPADDRAVFVQGTGSPTTGTGLPDAEVNALVEDRDGRVWLGTSRGLAYIPSPGAVFTDPAFLQPVWARTPDGASYFLRDLAIRAIAVDPANRKWLGTPDGLWLLNAEGNEVLAHFTPANSPLPDALVVDLAVDAASGTLYVATDRGLVSYRTDTVAPAARPAPLRVYPNPFRPDEHGVVHVEGLVERTRVRILTPAGEVVAAFDARGGAISWDGIDQRSGRPAPSGVYIVAAAGRDGEGVAYGRIALLR